MRTTTGSILAEVSGISTARQKFQMGSLSDGKLSRGSLVIHTMLPTRQKTPSSKKNVCRSATFPTVVMWPSTPTSISSLSSPTYNSNSSPFPKHDRVRSMHLSLPSAPIPNYNLLLSQFGSSSVQTAFNLQP